MLDRFSSRQALYVFFIAFLVATCAMLLMLFFVDPEAQAPLPALFLSFLFLLSGTGFFAPLFYVLKKARLRGRVSGWNIFSSLRQAFWCTFVVFGGWALFFYHVLTWNSFLFFALTVLFCEMMLRSLLRIFSTFS